MLVNTVHWGSSAFEFLRSLDNGMDTATGSKNRKIDAWERQSRLVLTSSNQCCWLSM